MFLRAETYIKSQYTSKASDLPFTETMRVKYLLTGNGIIRRLQLIKIRPIQQTFFSLGCYKMATQKN